jgi:integrase
MPRNRDIFAYSLPIMLFDPALDCRIKRRATMLALQFPEGFSAHMRDVWLLALSRVPLQRCFMAKSKDSLESLLALPYVELIDGKPYVRLAYFDERAGRRRSKTRCVHSVDDYASALEHVKRQIGAQPADHDPERMTFDELMNEFRKAKPKMKEWYAAPLEEFFGKRKIKSITYGDLKEFRAAREAVPKKGTDEPRKPATVNREMEWLREILLYAVRHEWLAKNSFAKGPATLIPKTEEESRERIPTPEEEARILEWCTDLRSWAARKREAKGITEEQLTRLIGAEAMQRIQADKGIKDSDISKVAQALGEHTDVAGEIARGKRAHLRPILIALRDTGLRKGALLSLTWKVVDLEGGFLDIPKGKANKGRPKIIAMTARLRAELSMLWEKSDKRPESLIFGGIGDFKRAYDSVCTLAGVEDLHVHDWRHGFATDLMEANVEEHLAMKATGHSNVETHLIYRNIDKRLAKVIAESLDRLHAEREKTGSDTVTDGTGFVS